MRSAIAGDVAAFTEELVFMARPDAAPAFVSVDTSNLTARQVALMEVALAPLPADLVIPGAFAHRRVLPGDPARARETWLHAVHTFLNARKVPKTEQLVRTREEY